MGEYNQFRQHYFKMLCNNHTVFSRTSNETINLNVSNHFIPLIFTFDMAVDENKNNANSQEIQTSTEEDDLLYTVSGKLVVTASDVAEVVALWTGLPATNLTRDQAERFLHLEQDLGNHIIGQEHALAAVSKSLRRYAAGLRNPKRPIGSFLLSGPTGVGKTELTKQLAENLFGSQKALIRLDM